MPEGYQPPTTEELRDSLIRQQERAARLRQAQLLREVGAEALTVTEDPDVPTD